MKKFNHLNIPQHWEQYWSKYPNGYSILESLIDWVSQVDDMVDNQNQTVDTVENFGDRLDEFLDAYDDSLSSTVEDTLSKWQTSGFLDVVIDAALQTQMDVLEQETEQKLSDFTTQMAETDEKVINNENDLTTVGVQSDSNLRIAYQYWNTDDIEMINDLKSLNLNTVFFGSRQSASQNTRTWEEAKRGLDIHHKHGIKVILSVDAEGIVDGDTTHREWFNKLVSHPGVIGIYGYDEPTLREIPVIRQENFSSYIRSVTNKPIFQANVASAEKTEYYYPEGFDVLLVSYYILTGNNSEPKTDFEEMETFIKRRISDFIKHEKTPKRIIPILPLFKDDDNGLKTKEEYIAHTNGWAEFYQGEYALYAYHNPVLEKDIRTDKLYRELAQATAGLLNKNFNGITPTFQNGLKIGGTGGNKPLKNFNILDVPITISNLQPNETRDIDFTVENISEESFVILKSNRSNLKTVYEGLIWNCFIISENTLTVRFHNTSDSAIHAPSVNYWQLLVVN